jgi:hypothetical protein
MSFDRFNSRRPDYSDEKILFTAKNHGHEKVSFSFNQHLLLLL